MRTNQSTVNKIQVHRLMGNEIVNSEVTVPDWLRHAAYMGLSQSDSELYAAANGRLPTASNADDSLPMQVPNAL